MNIMKNEEGKGVHPDDSAPKDQPKRKIKKGEAPVVCEIDEQSGRPTCCGPGDLSKIADSATLKNEQ
jgi:hypothetical protein